MLFDFQIRIIHPFTAHLLCLPPPPPFPPGNLLLARNMHPLRSPGISAAFNFFSDRLESQFGSQLKAGQCERLNSKLHQPYLTGSILVWHGQGRVEDAAVIKSYLGSNCTKHEFLSMIGK